MLMNCFLVEYKCENKRPCVHACVCVCKQTSTSGKNSRIRVLRPNYLTTTSAIFSTIGRRSLLTVNIALIHFTPSATYLQYG